MPKLSKQPPKLSRHSSGRAYITSDGQRVYLGKWNDPATHDAYEKLVDLWETMGGSLPNLAPAPKPSAIATVSMLCAEYFKHVTANEGERNQQFAKRAMKPLRRLCGRTGVDSFSPANLEEVRDVWVRRPLTRTTITEFVRIIIRMFKFGVVRGLVAPETWTALTAIEPLKRGRTTAKEPKKVGPVAPGAIRAIWPHLPKPLKALILLQCLTGARGGELFNLKAIDIDQSSEPWTLHLDEHKTRRHGHDRVIQFGPRARKVLKSFIVIDRPIDAPLFSPREAHAELRARNSTVRRRPNQKPNPRKTNRRMGEAYDKNSYNQAIRRACEKVGIERWTPHQLRHTALTRLRAIYGVEVAQTISGHALGSAITELYAEPNRKAAARAIEEAC